jgi:hypothetical protein
MQLRIARLRSHRALPSQTRPMKDNLAYFLADPGSAIFRCTWIARVLTESGLYQWKHAGNE